jgi:hypothetical protein
VNAKDREYLHQLAARLGDERLTRIADGGVVLFALSEAGPRANLSTSALSKRLERGQAEPPQGKYVTRGGEEMAYTEWELTELRKAEREKRRAVAAGK